MKTLEERDSELIERFRLRLQQFLQLQHGQSFSANFLARHLGIPENIVCQLGEEFLAKGIMVRPAYTEYFRGVAVDWAAVHAGKAERPAWAK